MSKARSDGKAREAAKASGHHRYVDLQEPSKENSRVLREIYVRAKQKPEHRRQLIGKQVVGPTRASALSRWLTQEKNNPSYSLDDEEPLSRENHLAVLQKLAAIGEIDGRVPVRDLLRQRPEHLFESLSVFLDIKPQGLDVVADRAVGVYRLWRPSQHIPGHFVRGMLEVWVDESRAVQTRETHHYKGADRSIPRKSVTRGYMLQKSSQYFVIGHDRGSRFVSSMFFNALFHEDEHGPKEKVVGMMGASLSVFGNHIHATRVYIERVTAEPAVELAKTLDIVPREEVPLAVLAKLLDVQPTEGGVRY